MRRCSLLCSLRSPRARGCDRPPAPAQRVPVRLFVLRVRTHADPSPSSRAPTARVGCSRSCTTLANQLQLQLTTRPHAPGPRAVACNAAIALSRLSPSAPHAAAPVGRGAAQPQSVHSARQPAHCAPRSSAGRAALLPSNPLLAGAGKARRDSDSDSDTHVAVGPPMHGAGLCSRSVDCKLGLGSDCACVRASVCVRVRVCVCVCVPSRGTAFESTK